MGPFGLKGIVFSVDHTAPLPAVCLSLWNDTAFRFVLGLCLLFPRLLNTIASHSFTCRLYSRTMHHLLHCQPNVMSWCSPLFEFIESILLFPSWLSSNLGWLKLGNDFSALRQNYDFHHNASCLVFYLSDWVGMKKGQRQTSRWLEEAPLVFVCLALFSAQKALEEMLKELKLFSPICYKHICSISK